MKRVGIVGITGYTGVELARLVAGHPRLTLTVAAAGASAGQPVTSSWPALRGLVDLPIEGVDVARLAEACDVVFLALPHGHSAALAPALVEAGVIAVDLGADFRLTDPAAYLRWYGLEHPTPAWLPRAVYGLPELHREALAGARLIACPGCYPTAVTLAAKPLVDAGLVEGPLVATCLSGVTGAGRKAGPRNLFSETHDSAAPYAIGGTHRHTPEMEQNLGVPVAFTPHLVPMNRGIVATVVARAAAPVDAAAVRALYDARYGEEPMVVVRDEPPTTADARGANRAHVHVAVDGERGVLTAIGVIDNLVKGASGQAVQALNAALGWPETLGVPLAPLLP